MGTKGFANVAAYLRARVEEGRHRMVEKSFQLICKSLKAEFSVGTRKKPFHRP
jgi:hypothetical protein